MGSVASPIGKIFQKTANLGREIKGEPPVKSTPAPTTAEVEQLGATDMDNKGIKRRRRGRSMTILTGSYGVQEGATLGTPTLLG